MNKRTPARVLAIRSAILANAVKTCARCDGAGERPDSARWVITTDKNGVVQGKFCFRCRGTGAEPARGITDPLTVRYTTADNLLPLVEAGDVDAVAAEEDAQDKAGIYWPILADVYGRAMAVAAYNRLSAANRRSAASYEALCEAVGADSAFLPGLN
jgi:hypothetical protein